MLCIVIRKNRSYLSWEASTGFAALPTAGPSVRPFPQLDEKSLDFGAAVADVKLRCPRCTGDSDDSG